jgi:hypothetical protein
VERLPERYANILNGVMIVDMGVARGGELKPKASVVGE